jgi:hypothetical protein
MKVGECKAIVYFLVGEAIALLCLDGLLFNHKSILLDSAIHVNSDSTLFKVKL